MGRLYGFAVPSDPAECGGLAVYFDEPSRPTLDDDCLLRYDGKWVALSPVQARVMSVLIPRFRGSVTSYEELRAAAWDTAPPSPGALTAIIKRLRRRIRPIGLDVLTVRLRGYVLDVRKPALA